jgi:hypothetical protein
MQIIASLRPRFLTLAMIRALVDDVPPRNAGDNAYNSSVANSPADDWDLSVGYSGAASMLAKGWPEGVERMRSLQSSQPPIAFESVQRLKLDFVGSRPCVPAFLGGDMRSMWRAGREAAPRPLLRVAFNINASCKVPADKLLGRAIAYCELVQQLESSGVDVEVYIFTLSFCKTYRKSKMGRLLPVYTLIKPAGQHVQPDMFLVTLGHPAFYRRCYFRVYESPLCVDAFPRHPYPVAYGHPVDPEVYKTALSAGIQHYAIAPDNLRDARISIEKTQSFEGLLQCHI